MFPPPPTTRVWVFSGRLASSPHSTMRGGFIESSEIVRGVVNLRFMANGLAALSLTSTSRSCGPAVGLPAR